jgi:hypothetical protein
VRDSIIVARENIPSIALVTEVFWPQGNFVAKSNGMPDIPRIQIPHPVAGSGEENMAAVATDITPEIISILTGA